MLVSSRQKVDFSLVKNKGHTTRTSERFWPWRVLMDWSGLDLFLPGGKTHTHTHATDRGTFSIPTLSLYLFSLSLPALTLVIIQRHFGLKKSALHWLDLFLCFSLFFGALVVVISLASPVIATKGRKVVGWGSIGCGARRRIKRFGGCKEKWHGDSGERNGFELGQSELTSSVWYEKVCVLRVVCGDDNVVCWVCENVYEHVWCWLLVLVLLSCLSVCPFYYTGDMRAWPTTSKPSSHHPQNTWPEVC